MTLGTVAVGLAIYWIGEQYGIEPQETLSFLGTAVLFVGLLVALGGLGFGGLLLVRRFTRDREKNDPT